MIHTLYASLFLPRPREQVFDFFSSAGNLARITPSEMGFEIRTPQPITMQVGTELEYRIRVFGVPMRWRSLITRWDPPREFIDEQLVGPYRQWIHTHRFHEADGGTRMEDQVRYEIRLQPLGELIFPLVKRQLDKVFEFRKCAIEQILLDGKLSPSSGVW